MAETLIAPAEVFDGEAEPSVYPEFSEGIALLDDEGLNVFDVLDHLESAGFSGEDIAFVGSSFEIDPPTIDSLRLANWEISILSQEEYDSFVSRIPDLQQVIKSLIELSGFAAHWQKNGRGESVSHKLLIGDAAENAINTGDDGNWQPAPEKKIKKTARTPRYNDDRTPQSDLVRQYLKEIGRYPLLSKEEEVELAKLIECGNSAQYRLDNKELTNNEVLECQAEIKKAEKARTKFINSNLRLVVSIAKRYQASGLPLLDLCQYGNIGVMHAVEKFDWRKGFKFSTYANWWIRQAVTRGIADSGKTIRLPIQAAADLNIIRSARKKLKGILDRDPSVEEIALYTEIPEDKVMELLLAPEVTASLDKPLTDESATTIGDLHAEPDSTKDLDDMIENTFAKDVVDSILGCLDEREKIVIKERFGLMTGEPKTLEEVGKVINRTRERTRQIEARALTKLRHPSVAGRIDASSLISR
jgi:RNA polymerase sigma factor (sigma-70 family)